MLVRLHRYETKTAPATFLSLDVQGIHVLHSRQQPAVNTSC